MKRVVFFLVVLLGLTSCAAEDGYPWTYINTDQPALVVISREEKFCTYYRYTHPVQLKNIKGANSFSEEPQVLTVFDKTQANASLPREMETTGVVVTQDWERGVWVTIYPHAPYSIYHINVKPLSTDAQTMVPNQIRIIRY